MLYFALYGVGAVAGIGPATVAAEVVFGAVAVALGVALFSLVGATPSVELAAAICLVGGGLAHFLALGTGRAWLSPLSSLAVLVGIGLYVLAIRTRQ